ncbi:hypothetical protein [Sporosarcina sp. FSL K6-5500]|uniref:hypothetical protein n=1 Tax=Sporosarcina sp. FSL K6-5500 TaxID=2921558 RepID=UPI0030FB93E3
MIIIQINIITLFLLLLVAYALNKISINNFFYDVSIIVKIYLYFIPLLMVIINIILMFFLNKLFGIASIVSFIILLINIGVVFLLGKYNSYKFLEIQKKTYPVIIAELSLNKSFNPEKSIIVHLKENYDYNGFDMLIFKIDTVLDIYQKKDLAQKLSLILNNKFKIKIYGRGEKLL